MRIRRREMLHLIGAAPISGALAAACNTDDATPAPEPGPCEEAWWLCGNFAPVQESDATDLEVVGALPPTLQGVYARNGPNPKGGSSAHWFLGDGMVHAVRLEGGQARWYRNRYVETDLLDAPPSDVIGPPGLTEHQANTSLLAHDDQLLCLSEAGIPYAISRDELTTVGPFDFGGQLDGSMTAHPKRDPVSGETVFFGYDAIAPSCRYYVLGTDGMLTKRETIELPTAVMMHDFQITASHVVWMDLPILFDLDLALDGAALPFSWQPSNGSRIGVMPRDGGNPDVQWFEIENCFVFHTFNAFMDRNDPRIVHLDAVRYPDMWVTSTDNLNAEGRWWRYSMNLDTGEVVAAQMDDRVIEFPRIDARRQGQPHGLAYALMPSGRGFGALVKYDLESGSATVAELDVAVDEATFVPDSDAAGEDEGWLVMYGYREETQRSELIVLDATDIAAGPVGRVLLPQRVPHGFHGTFSPG